MGMKVDGDEEEEDKGEMLVVLESEDRWWFENVKRLYP